LCSVVLFFLPACDDSLPPATDRGVNIDAAVDATTPDTQRSDLLPEDLPLLDAGCTRPDGFCKTNADCAEGLICNAAEVCKPDPCCEGGPETCEAICTGLCEPPPSMLEAQIVSASGWYVQEPAVEELTEVEMTIYLVNDSARTLVEPVLVETRLISQSNPAKVELLNMAPLEVILPPHDTVTVTTRNLPSSGPASGKWSCSANEQVRIATFIEYTVSGETDRARTKELWSDTFPFECRQDTP
jgi:hypothetical protein